MFAAVLVFRTALYVLGALSRPKATSPETELDDWPVYTLLIALKDEAETAAQLAAAIRALNYPASRLDVKLLIEAGDEATAYALRRQRWPDRTELLVVPPGLPRTKPRALNYGLARARGTFVILYDAEDRPRADQLKAAVRAFHAAGPDLACVQAPLAGAGGWDAWYVTEDADLGLRLARAGLRVGMIAPPTREAPAGRGGGRDGAQRLCADAADSGRGDPVGAGARALGGVAGAGFRGSRLARGAGVPDAGCGLLRGRDADGAGRAGKEGLAARGTGGDAAALLAAAIGRDGAGALRPREVPALLGEDAAPGLTTARHYVRAPVKAEGLPIAGWF
ncbi:MAG: glycosyltransferase [Alphaproteobacteria bacterium]|uniref:glycosyltransferase n=1 Tax=Hyphomonas sp. TaxID=87 RepID=UPI001DF62994|nr:glycosyltransferase [Hyphomonas sp.]MBU4063686.1 glycosyltransferase [Alphaproteobacteria bacterium]MBU4569035.1 glycosyltransferase [Alphaproteobacteria bacterium]